jgi:xanthine dehydrogenase large subunit
MLYLFGSRQIRNRATMGGNLATASPIGDSAPVLLALDARVVLAFANNERALPIEEFFVGYRKTALAPGEVLKTIVIPRTANRRTKFYKASKRREMDISTVAGCFTIELDANNIIKHTRLAYGGVALTPVRARKTEAALLGKIWNAETLMSILPVLEQEFTPISDVRGSNSYRQRLITTLFERFFYDDDDDDDDLESKMALTKLDGIMPSSFPSTSGDRPQPHESGHKHVTGEAIYVDDATVGEGMLEVWPVCSPHARAKILRRDATAAKTMPGIKTVLLAEDVPGLNDVGAVRHDEVLLADKEIS